MASWKKPERHTSIQHRNRSKSWSLWQGNIGQRHREGTLAEQDMGCSHRQHMDWDSQLLPE